MTSLPTRDEINIEYRYRYSRTDVETRRYNALRDLLFLAYIDGTLQTQEEFITNLDVEAAAIEFRRKIYEPETPDRIWGKLAPGAQETWRMHTQCVLDAALHEATL